MITRFLPTAILAIVAVVHLTAPVSSATVISRHQGWEIVFDPASATTCFLRKRWTDGKTVKSGPDLETGNWWLSIDVGTPATEVPIGLHSFRVVFDKSSQWDLNASYSKNDDKSFFKIFSKITDFEFHEQFRKSYSMSVIYSGNALTTIDLTGSARAYAKLENCILSVNDVKN